MAINDIMPGVKVEVFVNGQALTEHTDKDLDNDERTITRYIEAISGEEFEIRVELDEEFKFKGNCLSWDVFADGQLLTEHTVRAASKKRCGISDSINDGDGTKRAFRFASLETVSDGRITDNEVARVKELGTIKVELNHQRVTKTNNHRSNLANQLTSIVSEKALKGRAISHTVELGEAQKSTSMRTYTTRSLPGEAEPGASIVFCYRSLAALKSMLIIPRTPSPPPLVERDVATLSLEEMRELQKQLIAMRGKEEARIKVKREEADANPRPRKVARPSAGDTQLELDDDGRVRESSTATLEGPVVIEID